MQSDLYLFWTWNERSIFFTETVHFSKNTDKQNLTEVTLGQDGKNSSNPVKGLGSLNSCLSLNDSFRIFNARSYSKHGVFWDLTQFTGQSEENDSYFGETSRQFCTFTDHHHIPLWLSNSPWRYTTLTCDGATTISSSHDHLWVIPISQIQRTL